MLQFVFLVIVAGGFVYLRKLLRGETVVRGLQLREKLSKFFKRKGDDVFAYM